MLNYNNGKTKEQRKSNSLTCAIHGYLQNIHKVINIEGRELGKIDKLVIVLTTSAPALDITFIM